MEEYKITLVKEKTISIEQIKSDINYLEEEFKKMGQDWENYDGYANYCTPIAQRELSIVKTTAEDYPFKINYNPSEYDANSKYYADEWFTNDIFTISDFSTNNITENNYGKADAVAFDIKEDLVAFLKQFAKELEWLPSRFRQEFIELIYESPQTTKSVRKNAEYFSESILDELTEEEKASMFVTL